MAVPCPLASRTHKHTRSCPTTTIADMTRQGETCCGTCLAVDPANPSPRVRALAVARAVGAGTPLCACRQFTPGAGECGGGGSVWLRVWLVCMCGPIEVSHARRRLCRMQQIVMNCLLPDDGAQLTSSGRSTGCGSPKAVATAMTQHPPSPPSHKPQAATRQVNQDGL